MMQPAEIPEEAVEAAAKEFFGAAWYVPDNEMNDVLRQGAREALEAAAPHLAPAVPQPVDREVLQDAVGEVWPWDDSDEQARDLRNDVVDAVLALLNGSQ